MELLLVFTSLFSVPNAPTFSACCELRLGRAHMEDPAGGMGTGLKVVLMPPPAPLPLPHSVFDILGRRYLDAGTMEGDGVWSLGRHPTGWPKPKAVCKPKATPFF